MGTIAGRPLGEVGDGESAATGGTPPLGPAGEARGVALVVSGVSVRAGGATLLAEVDLVIGPGEHLAIVGPSGAGKSSLIATLLGWHQPAEGRVLADGCPVGGERLVRLRGQAVWIDPAVQLWHRSLGDNLRFGNEDWDEPPADVLREGEMLDLLARLPGDVRSELGEAGRRLSGGEGQRVRVARGFLRRGVRLALLDEPFRGLDRAQRALLLGRARQRWRDATLLCITHDLRESARFPRVVVLDGGRIVEDGSPARLAGEAGSRYRELLAGEERARRALGGTAGWRRARVVNGRLRALSGENREVGDETTQGAR
jgi:ABC-type transport system involved in cytochrome bd biosynthesis fused ATPase/permease subunit